VITTVGLTPRRVVLAPPPTGVQFPIVWAQGSPIGTDPNPNTTPPASNRILTLDPQGHQALLTWANTALIRLIAIGGVSVTVTAWTYDVASTTWLALAAATTITVATLNIAGVAFTGAVSGSQWFMQITAVNGVTALGYCWS
jgi:hypothetical protein